MEFTLKIDKKAQARIDKSRCINCGECRQICPTGAIEEYQKSVSGIFSQVQEHMIESSCSTGCPMGIIAQTVAAFVRDGETEKAYQHIAERNPMPWVCSETCEAFCEAHCKLQNIGEAPIDMRQLEKEAVRVGTPPVYELTKPAYDKIAIIGGGPAGIMAAFELRRAGYRPVIFEKRDRLGGAAGWGISDLRLDKEKYHAEIDHLIGTGIEVRYNYALGENFTLQQVWKEGFAACLMATGMDEPVQRRIIGANCKGVFEALEILRELNDGGYSPREKRTAPEGTESMGEKISVVGCGRLAAEAARVLAARGKQVILIPVKEENPEENAEEIPEDVLGSLSEAGVDIRPMDSVRQVISDPDGVKAIEIIDRGHATNLFCDGVVLAFGLRSDVERISKVETYPDGTIRTDGSLRTNKRNIYACGDVTGKSRSVTEAMGQGRKAAQMIDADLRGTGDDTLPAPFRKAPAGETIYPENILGARDFRAIGEPGGPCIDDIGSVLRDAGVTEHMPVWFEDEGPEEASDHKKAAIIGGGIAGVTAAISLAKKGIRPTIYEKTARLGGSCRWLATNRRYDREVLDRELAKIEETGIRVIYNAAGGVNPDLLDLMKAYDSVLLAIGETAGKKPDIPGTDARGVFDIIGLMTMLNNGEIPEGIGERVAVAGGDEISVDAARALKRICREVTLLAPCSKGKLQIKTSAVETLLNEGINLVTGVVPAEIHVKDGAADSVSCTVVENGSSLGIPCDTLVFGEGKGPDMMTISLKNLYLDLDEGGYARTNSRLATNMRSVFALGDFNMSSVDAGRAGAAAVSNYLNDQDSAIVVERFRPEEMSVEHERIPGRPAENMIRPAEHGLAEEAGRCISCGYHKAGEMLCIGCGICQKYCPAGAIWMEGIGGASTEKGAK